MFKPDGQSRFEDQRGAMAFDRVKLHAPGAVDPREAQQEQPRPNPKPAALDSEESLERWRQLLGFYTHELDVQAENRMQMAADEDFYDSIQFTDQEVQTLNDRGQSPLVFNVTKTTVNWVLGSQRRAPKDYRILPRTKAGAEAAQRKSELLKHISDENLADFEVAEAFESAVKVGVGWLECSQGRPDDGARVIFRAEDWRAILWDSTARRYDLADARYIFRTKWLDVDVAESLWPKRKLMIRQSSSLSIYGAADLDDLGDEAMDSQEDAHFDLTAGIARRGDKSHNRARIRVIEGWFKVPMEASVMRGGQFNGEIFDEWSEGHIEELRAGRASIAKMPREVIHMAIFTDAGLLDMRQSPYRHNRFPFTPVWGYRRGRDRMPYGMIRDIRDPQRDLNRRAAKALHFLSTTRVTVEEGAVEDIEELRDEAARPDAVIVYKTGKQAPQIDNNTNLAAAHVEMMDRDQAMIQSIGGVTDENLGRRTNATSGIAIERRQSQGALATSTFFENLRRTRLTHGEKLIVLIETFYDKMDEFRVTDARGNPDFKTINDGTAAGAIAKFKSDFVIDEDDWRASARQAQAEALLQLASQLAQTAPQLVVGILDLIVEALDVPKRDEIVKRVRNLTGAEDPDADPNNPTPEMQQKAAEAARMKELQDRDAEATIMEKEAKARKLMAEAKASEEKGQDAYIARLKAAFEAAIAVAGAPAVAAAADQILSDAMAAEAGNAGVMPAQPMQGQPMPPQQMPPEMAQPPVDPLQPAMM